MTMLECPHCGSDDTLLVAWHASFYATWLDNDGHLVIDEDSLPDDEVTQPKPDRLLRCGSCLAEWSIPDTLEVLHRL